MAKNIHLSEAELLELITTVLTSEHERSAPSYPNLLGLLTEAVLDCSGGGYLHMVIATETPAGHSFEIQVSEVPEESPFNAFAECELVRRVGEHGETEVPTVDTAVKVSTE